MPTAQAVGPVVFLPSLLIELDAQLGWPLENMKELAKWQIEQRGNHCDGMQNCQKFIEAATQPQRRNRECQPGNRNGKQQDQWQKVHRERLHGASAAVEQSAPQRERDSGEDEHGGKIQAMKNQP